MKTKNILLAVCMCLAVMNAKAQGYWVNDSTAPNYQENNYTEPAWEDKIVDRIDELLKSSIFKTSTVGIEVYDITANKLLYTYNESQTMRPASTQKVLTAVTALDRLGGYYEFKTRLYYDGEIADGVLNGDLYCIGGFDPAFNAEDLESFVSAVAEAGIDTIRGGVYADLHFKDDGRLGEGWCWDDDNPTLTPLMVAKKDNFLQRFSSMLRQRGIVIHGATGEADTPHTARQLYIVTHSIDHILKRMMKNSDNTYAESMFYQLGGTAKQAKVYVNSIIQKVGLNPSDYYVADGSGLSLYNYVSPHEEVMFLRYAYDHKEIFEHLYPSLPIAGVDGTLEKRMRGTHAEGNVHAKTGTVTGVSSLAGYLDAPNNHFICFSIINMGIRQAATGRNFQDQVCAALCRP